MNRDRPGKYRQIPVKYTGGTQSEKEKESGQGEKSGQTAKHDQQKKKRKEGQKTRNAAGLVGPIADN